MSERDELLASIKKHIYFLANAQGRWQDTIDILEAAFKALSAPSAIAATSEFVSVLDKYEQETKALPMQHEIQSRGCCSYNWRMAIIRELRAMIAAAPAPASATEATKPVAWLKTKAPDLRRVDLFPELDTWMQHAGGWSVTPLYAAPAPASATEAQRHWNEHAVNYTLQCLERWAGKMGRAGFTDEVSRCEYVRNIIKADFSEELLPVEAGATPDAYAVQMADGHWVGLWHDKDIAELVAAKHPKGEVVCLLRMKLEQ